MDMNHFKLQFITHFTDTYSYLDSARMALEGGCRWVQLRMKHASDEETEAVALEVQKLCRTYGATFLIDDRVELVRKLKADGVHLGKNDMPIAEARKSSERISSSEVRPTRSMTYGHTMKPEPTTSVADRSASPPQKKSSALSSDWKATVPSYSR